MGTRKAKRKIAVVNEAELMPRIREIANERRALYRMHSEAWPNLIGHSLKNEITLLDAESEHLWKMVRKCRMVVKPQLMSA